MASYYFLCRMTSLTIPERKIVIELKVPKHPKIGDYLDTLSVKINGIKKGRQKNLFHFTTIPFGLLEISKAILVRIRDSFKPPGDARYFGSHSGSNFSLYRRKP